MILVVPGFDLPPSCRCCWFCSCRQLVLLFQLQWDVGENTRSVISVLFVFCVNLDRAAVLMGQCLDVSPHFRL